jgi:hypothetical protein
MNEKNEKLYSETRQDLLNRQLSNTQNYDRAILSLSTAGLGFSLAFIKDLIDLTNASHIGFLYYSWTFFLIAIMLTLISFVSSQKAIDKQLFFAEQYYLNGKKEFLNKNNWLSHMTNWIFYSSWLIFLIAIFLTVIFVKINLFGGNV